MQFIDLQKQYSLYKDEIRREMDEVLDTGRFIQGPAVSRLEADLAAFAGAKHAIACSSGTDALLLALMALDLKAGDEVIVPDFTFFATAEVVSLLGAKPVFADVCADTLNIDPKRAEAAITPRTRGIIAVSLYGQCADFDELNALAARRKLFLLEDGAQSFGGSYQGRKSCSLCELATTSFYPAKPLGAYGDGGAVFTSSDAMAEKIRFLLNHGQNASYRHRYIGINGRLDSLQAAVLVVKLRHFADELEKRQGVAGWYGGALEGSVQTPVVRKGNVCSWAQYTVRSPKRARVIEQLKAKGIPTAIHYPMPVHRQEAYAGAGDKGLEQSIRASEEVFSLPMHPFLTREEAATVAAAIREAVR